MTRLNRWSVATLAVLGVVAAASGVVAQDKTKIVKDRQDSMKKLGGYSKTISDYTKGMKTKDDALKAIADLQAATAKMPSWFAPTGTSSTDLPGVSLAKAAIWTEKDKFADGIKSLQALEAQEADLIKTGSPDDVAKFAPQMGMKGCGACHAAYREKVPGPGPG